MADFDQQNAGRLIFGRALAFYCVACYFVTIITRHEQTTVARDDYDDDLDAHSSRRDAYRCTMSDFEERERARLSLRSPMRLVDGNE